MKTLKKTRQWAFIFLTFLAAYILMILPIPHHWQWLRPEFLTLVLMYWIFVQPQFVGIAIAWCAGLVMDVLYGGILGQYALSLVMIAFLARLLRYRIRLIPTWQQVVMIFILLAVGRSVLFLVQWMSGNPPKMIYYCAPLLTSVICWPWMRRLMNFYERKVLA